MAKINNFTSIATIQQDLTINQKLCHIISTYAWGWSDVNNLIRQGANVNYVDQYGWSPLHLAYKRGRNDIAKLLLQHGANKDKVSENHEAQTPAV
jgi:ankyrin repeat protein